MPFVQRPATKQTPHGHGEPKKFLGFIDGATCIDGASVQCIFIKKLIRMNKLMVKNKKKQFNEHLHDEY